jgi:hypothetical protein
MRQCCAKKEVHGRLNKLLLPATLNSLRNLINDRMNAKLADVSRETMQKAVFELRRFLFIST